jgi:hypothetical protein
MGSIPVSTFIKCLVALPVLITLRTQRLRRMRWRRCAQTLGSRVSQEAGIPVVILSREASHSLRVLSGLRP